jgi:hypothetical protein
LAAETFEETTVSEPSIQPSPDSNLTPAAAAPPDIAEGDYEGLSPAQEAALDQLLGGASIAQCARTVKISRRTIHRWLREDAAFQAVYQQGKEDMTVTARTRLLMAVEVAARNIEKAVNLGDTKISLRVMERMGVMAPPAIGPTYDQLRAENQRLRNQERQRSNAAAEEAERFLSGGDEKKIPAQPPRS